MTYDATSDAQPAALLQSLLEFMEAIGVPRRRLLSCTRITSANFTAHGVVARADMDILIAQALAFSGNEALGLQWSTLGRPFGYGTLLFAVAESVRACRESRSADWIPWRGTPHPTSIRRHAHDLVVRVAAGRSSEGAYKVYVEAIFSMFMRLIGGTFRPLAAVRNASFTYRAPRSIADYEAMFRCPCTFDAEVCELVVHLPETDDAIRHAHDGHPRSWSEAVIEQMSAGIRVRPQRIDNVARALGISVRTLRRKLAREGTSFSRIVSGTREAPKEYTPRVAATSHYAGTSWAASGTSLPR